MFVSVNAGRRLTRALCLFTLAAGLVAAPALADPLMAGTGKAAIDPSPALFPIDNGTGDAPFTGVHDSLNARALVLAQGDTRVIMVAADMIILPDEVYHRLVARIADTYHTPKDHIWLTATHVHTVPWSLGKGYEQTVSDGILAAIAEADKVREPVGVGYGEGQAYININRDEDTPQGFILGQNPSGPSDKTVRVTGFFRADGTPLAILANYAVHAVTLHSSVTGEDHTSLISADIPGATDAFVDAHYGNAMTFWTSGAAGDQNPVMMSIYAEPGADGKPVFTDLKAEGFKLVDRWGQNLGLEIIRVTDAMKPASITGSLKAAQTVVTCPTKTDPATPKSIRLSWLGIGDINLLGISGELVTGIDQNLRSKAGAAPLLTLTLTNGYSGYIPDEAGYARGQTFEVQHSPFAPGCAKNAIVSAALNLLPKP